MLDTLLSCHREIEYRAVFTLCSPGVARDLQLARLKMFDEFNPCAGPDKRPNLEDKYSAFTFGLTENSVCFDETISRNIIT